MARDDDDTAPMLASDDFAWQKLPPLPAPKAHRRQEALCGTLVVLASSSRAAAGVAPIRSKTRDFESASACITTSPPGRKSHDSSDHRW